MDEAMSSKSYLGPNDPLTEKPKQNEENKEEPILEDNQVPNNNSETSSCSNNVLEAEVEGYEEPVAGPSNDQRGTVGAKESDEVLEPPPEVAMAARIAVPDDLEEKIIKMDELNDCTWDLLTENAQEGEDIPPNTFLNIYSKLPDKLSDDMRESLSGPIAFLSLLHLASEKGLTLEQKENLEDIDISGINKD